MEASELGPSENQATSEMDELLLLEVIGNKSCYIPSVTRLSTLQFTSLTVVGPSIELTFSVKNFEV